MRRKMIAAGLIALSAVTGTAYAASASTPVSGQARACQAAITYAQHPTPAGLSRAISGIKVFGRSLLSRPVSRSYLAADALDVLATDYSPSRSAPRYLPRGVRFFAQDCLG